VVLERYSQGIISSNNCYGFLCNKFDNLTNIAVALSDIFNFV